VGFVAQSSIREVLMKNKKNIRFRSLEVVFKYMQSNKPKTSARLQAVLSSTQTKERDSKDSTA